MAFVMGRSYGVHLRACVPSAPFSSHSLVSVSRLASCFFLRFSSSSCRTRRLKLCAAPSSSSSRTPALLIHNEAEQAGVSSTCSASHLRQPSVMKRGSSLEAEAEAGKVNVSAVEEASGVAVTSRKSTKRKKAVHELPSQQTLDNEVAASKVAVTSNSRSARKKMYTPTLDSIVMDAPATEQRPLAKSSPRKKRSASADVESKEEFSFCNPEGRLEPSASTCTSSLPLEIPKKSTRKKKALPLSGEETIDSITSATKDEKTSREKINNAIDKDGVTIDMPVRNVRKKKVLSSSMPVEEIANSATAMTQNKKALKGKSSDVIDTDGITIVTPNRKARKKKASSSSLSSLEEMSAGMKIDTICEKQAEINMLASSELSKPNENAMPSRRRKQSIQSRTAVKGLVHGSPVNRSAAANIETVIPAPDPTREGEEEFSLNGGQKDSKVGDGAAQMTVRSGSSESMIPITIQKRKSRLKETLPSLGNDGSPNIVLEKFIAKGTSTVCKQEFKVESTLEPCVPQTVRKVENSVDKASLTNEMPDISFADAHTAHRRRQSEALSLQNDFYRKSAANVPQDLTNLSVATTSAFPRPSSLLEDALDSFKDLARQNTTEDQSTQSEFTSLGKVPLMRHDWTESRTTDHDEDGFASRTSKVGTLRGPSSGQKQTTPGRAPSREERVHRSNVIPTISERRESNSQQWTRWSKSSTHGAAEATIQRWETETSYRKQFAMTNHRETHLQQGYVLANIDRARGRDRKKRKEFFVRNVVANQSSTLSYMQIFGTGFDTGDTAPTVLLFFDRRRFLFNVGEGLQRFCMEHKFKLSKIDHVFLTRVCSETVGGLPGLILALAEMKETGLTVKTWGPSSLDDLAQAMRLFIPSGWMEHTHSFGPGANDHTLSKTNSSSQVLLLEDELIKISAVLLCSEDTAHSKTNFLSPAEQMNGSMPSTVYICELSVVRGKFNPEKARAKGLRPGCKYGKLQNGESVLSDDGKTMVHPEDVLGPSSPGPIMFVVDCPSMSYVPSLTSSTSLQSFFSETGKVVNCIIHIGPASVTSSKEYQSWMENFKHAHHIMAQPEVKVLGTPTLTSCTRTLWKLNLVCPWLFPVMEIDAKNEKEAGNGHMVAGKNLLKYRLRPLSDLGLDSSEVPEGFDPAALQEKWDTLSPEILRARDMACQVWKRWSEEKSAESSWKDRGNRNCQSLPRCLYQVSRDEMEIVFLGTGSSQPSKHRNVTGIYIHFFKKGGMLLDCGEGTFAQLKRRYGAKGADDVLLGLKCIWISHMHADHFTGILRILTARRELLQAQSTCEPILVIGPKKLKFFLDSYGKIEDLQMEFLDCSQTTLEVQRWANGDSAEVSATHKKEGLIHMSTRGPSGRSGMQHIWKQPGYHIQQGIDIAGRKRLRMVLEILGLKELYSVPVIHCPNAFAVVLKAQERKLTENATTSGWKLVFSGDTRPCQALVEAAQDATILIHEATFEDDLISEAVKKNHSITNEAIKVGVDAGAYRIFLTHFSQRYPTIPYFDNRFKDRACMAFDMMSVNLADLPIVPEFLPALQMLFKDRSDAEEEAEGANALSV